MSVDAYKYVYMYICIVKTLITPISTLLCTASKLLIDHGDQRTALHS